MKLSICLNKDLYSKRTLDISLRIFKNHFKSRIDEDKINFSVSFSDRVKHEIIGEFLNHLLKMEIEKRY